MLDRRPERQIQSELEAERKGAFGRWLDQARQPVTAPRTFSHLMELLMVIAIISLVAALMAPVYWRAQRSAHITTCLEKLNEIGQAMEIYRMDYGAYPQSSFWYGRLRGHMGSIERKADPLKCTADPTDAPVSYYYLDKSLLPPAQWALSLSEIPMAVDETYHPDKVTILWYDYHKSVMRKAVWMNLRSEVLKIRRDTEHEDWFRFVPKPPSTELAE